MHRHITDDPVTKPRPLPATLSATLIGIAVLGGAAGTAITDEKAFSGTVLEQVELGNLDAGERVLKMTLLEMQPGAEIPSHTHQGPGLRYVLEGAIGVAWKDGDLQTYEAGSTYFEEAGENHPATEMSARNMSDSETRVLIVELLPKQ